ncbi:MAG: sugar transferase [Bacteroidales bacterium]|nr:sugar transferase [Bacteroidales bacterium]
MIKVFENNISQNQLFAVLDILVTVFSYFLAYILTDLMNKDYFAFTREYFIMLIFIIPTWLILLYSLNLTQTPRTRSHLSVFFTFLNFSFVGFILMLLYKHLFNLTNFSHYFILSFSIINLIALYLFRMTTYRIFKYYRANLHNIKNILVYANDQSEKFLDTIIKHKEWGFRILIIVTNSMSIRKKYGQGIRIYPDKININNIIDIDIIDEVVYCHGSIDYRQLRMLIKTCKEIGVTFRLQLKISSHSVMNSHITVFEDIPFITYENTPVNSITFFWKSFSDVWISFGILLLVSPLMCLIAILIKATSKGPILFKQERVGLRGRKFYIYKFRTMISNAEELKVRLLEKNESDGPVFKIKDDPRITKLGKILRKTGLDELPQLFNVLKGEMSLIGPRPPLPSEVTKYERWHLRRLSVKPGITCTWQVMPNRNNVIFDKWMNLDVQYIDKWSIKEDIKILFRTVKTVFYPTGY